MNASNKYEWLKAFPIDIKSLYEKADEPLPHSIKRWWWCWGGIIGLLFMLQVVTGLLLAFYYRAEPGTAYETVSFISDHARFGGFVRSVHNWGATFMVVFLFLHMVRVFVTSAFRQFRWGSWMAGVFLLAVTLGFAFTGYSLVYEQRSYWAITVTSNILSYVPVLGNLMKHLFLAGEDINSNTLSRMYALHVQIFPVLLILFGAVHIFFIRLMGMYQPGNQRDLDAEEALTKKEGVYHFYPDHLASETLFFLYLVLVISLLAIAFPVAMGPPADPMVTPEHIKPEWYFFPMFHLLKLLPGASGVIVMGLLGVLLFLWPIVDHYMLQPLDKRLWKGKFETGLLCGFVVVGFYLLWGLFEINV